MHRLIACPLVLLLASVAVASPQDDLAGSLRGKSDEDVFTSLARLAGGATLDADRAAIEQALAGGQVPASLRQLLASAQRIRVADGAVQIVGASKVQLRGADLIPGDTLTVRRDGGDLRCEGLVIGPRDGSRYELRSVRRALRDGQPALQLDVARDGQERNVTLLADHLAARPAQPAQESPVLRRGDSGPEVRELQERLAAHRQAAGLPEVPQDGRFGPETGAALRDFQRARGLPVGGEADYATWRALRGEPVPGAAAPASSEPATPPLWQGDYGPEVRDLQARLNAARREAGANPIPETGRFDEATTAAVRELQAGRGLDATGIVDRDTWGRLLQPEAERRARIAAGPELARDARGEQVRQLQHLLNVHRWNAGQSSIDEDGIFGPVTELAVRSFQRRQGLPETGRADGVTWEALSRVPAHREGAPVRTRPAAPSQPGPSQPSQPGADTTVAPPLPSAEGGTRLDAIQLAAVESARHELSLGVSESGGSNRGGRIDLYARTAGMSTGYEWCGFFASFNYAQASRRMGLTWAGQTVLHSVGKVRAFFLYRSYTQSWTSSNVARWEGTRAAHQRQGSARRYMVFQDSSGHRYARSNGLTAEVYGSYRDLPVRAGDFVVWSRSGGNGHIGLVEHYDQGTGRLTTIEGNTSNAVRRRVYELSSSSARATIDGFGRPAMGDFTSAP